MYVVAPKVFSPQVGDFYHRDIWLIDALGIEIPPYLRVKHINFTNISQDWLRTLAKQFIYHQSVTKAMYSLFQYKMSLK